MGSLLPLLLLGILGFLLEENISNELVGEYLLYQLVLRYSSHGFGYQPIAKTASNRSVK